jgi:S1-C subfamily serine protease
MSAATSNAGAGTLAALSTQLAGAVETASASIVSIHARRRIPSSGIVWSTGVIVSASHTVKREDDIHVTLPNGESASATIAGRDPSTDLIALRFNASGTRVADRGDADALRVGALVLAVGRPGKNATASFGIVSALGDGWRTWQGSRIDRVARLDLSVYDGFSGGPLIDVSGRVLGVNNSALARGTPMALPVSVVDRVVNELLDRGHVRRPYIGVAVQPVTLTPSAAQKLGTAQESALLVISVADGSPADTAGIVVGDVLLEANATALRGPTDLLDAITGTATGKPIALKLLRGGAAKQVQVTPIDRGDGE